jgi:hypothetical protein
MSSRMVRGKSKRKVVPRAATNGTGCTGTDRQSAVSTAGQRSNELDFVFNSGLFDTEFYHSRYPDIIQAAIPTLEPSINTSLYLDMGSAAKPKELRILAFHFMISGSMTWNALQ